MNLIRVLVSTVVASLLLLNSCVLLDNDSILGTDLYAAPSKDELDSLYEPYWDEETRKMADTAADIPYLSQVEKEIFYYLNLARINPSLFAITYATGYEGKSGYPQGYAFSERKKNLILELQETEPISLIYPDEVLYDMAKCFATEGGQLGLRGHDRSETSCEKAWQAESCYYGNCDDGLHIIMSLLIDFGEGNSNLGHRRLCLNGKYSLMGVSIQPHIRYTNVAVMDF